MTGQQVKICWEKAYNPQPSIQGMVPVDLSAPVMFWEPERGTRTVLAFLLTFLLAPPARGKRVLTLGNLSWAEGEGACGDGV